MKILCLHQGYELYGSDRTFLQSVDAFRRRFPAALITVVLPREGPLYERMKQLVDDVRILDLLVLRKSRLRPANIVHLPGAIGKVAKARRWIQEYDLTYINSVVVLDFILAAGLVSQKSIVHVHEIPSRLAGRVFSALLRFSGAHVVFNSDAARDSIKLPHGASRSVVHNGVKAFPGARPPEPGGRKLHLLLLGRFNAWKGQTLLVEAVGLLDAQVRAAIEVRLVGSVFEDQRHFETAIHDAIRKHGIADTVRMQPFIPDPAPLYEWADVVVVPSTQPEPFGLVAVEAMAAARAVIGAGHGGLLEIVVDGETGALFKPGDAKALADCIGQYVRSEGLATRHGTAGLARFEAVFREDRYMDAIAGEAVALLRRNGWKEQ